MKFIVALTGGIGSGKSTIADVFADFGASIIDADTIAREVVKPNSEALHAIEDHFGPMILHSDGSLNRAMLRTLIFNNPAEKAWLNSLLHPVIHRKTEQKFMSIKTSSYILWVVPLLIENNLHQRANRILVVDSDSETQIMRTLKRDSVNRKEVESILAAQVSRRKRLFYANDIIINNVSLKKIKKYVFILHKNYLAYARAMKSTSISDCDALISK